MLENTLIQRIVMLRDKEGMSLIGISGELGALGAILGLRMFDSDEVDDANKFAVDLGKLLGLPVNSFDSITPLSGAREKLGHLSTDENGNPFVTVLGGKNHEA